MLQAEHMVGHVEGVMTTLVGAAFIGMNQGRQQAVADRQIRAARTARAAAAARAGVLSDTAADLRERLADAVADADDLRDDVHVLQAQVARLMADRKILADALTARRAG